MFLDLRCLRIHQLSLSKPPPVGHQLAEMHTVDREFVYPAMKGTIMIVTTTYNVEGRQISEYIRVVAGETVSGINMFRDLAAGQVGATGVGGDGEAGGNGESQPGHLRQVRSLATQEILLVLVTLAEAVHVLGHPCLFRFLWN